MCYSYSFEEGALISTIKSLGGSATRDQIAKALALEPGVVDDALYRFTVDDPRLDTYSAELTVAENAYYVWAAVPENDNKEYTGVWPTYPEGVDFRAGSLARRGFIKVDGDTVTVGANA